tara:strand:- start:67 stop:675 length:609 start_codon:yes stop_codon:yes gene_type:complete
MVAKVTNNAFGTLSASINSSVTTIALDSGQGAKFPSITGTDFFFATLIDTSNNLEIVKVTARSSDSMTVVRAHDNTTARSFSIGDRFELRPVAALFESITNGVGIIGEVNAVSSAGAISLTHLVTEVTTGGSAIAISLANGTAGQIKIISMVVDGGGTATLTPATFANGTTVAFADVNDTVMLLYANTIGWVVVANSGATVS